MAYTTKKSVSTTALTSPTRNADITIVCSRSSIDSKKVVATVTVTQGFGSGTTSETKTEYEVSFTSSKGTGTAKGVLNTAGTLWDWNGSNDLFRLNQEGTTVQGRKPTRRASATNVFDSWIDGKTRTITVKLWQKDRDNGKTNRLEKEFNIVCDMPKYSSSGGGSTGGGTTTIGANKITSFTATPSPGIIGEEVKLTIKTSAGTNNNISKLEIVGREQTGNNVGWPSTMDHTVNNPASTETYTTTLKYPKTDYMAFITSGKNNAVVSSMITIVGNPPPPEVISAKISPNVVNNKTGGDVTLIVKTNTKDAQGRSDSFCYSINNGQEKFDWMSVRIHVNAGDIIKVYAYDGVNEKKSQYGTAIRVNGYTPIEINSFNVTPKILKDNLSSPDLVNIIERASVNANGHSSIRWQYKTSATSSGLSNASWLSLNDLSSSSISNIDMTQYIRKGYYYQISAILSNADISQSTTPSEIYQIPSKPGRATSLRVIPKADPEDGYTEIIKDGKAYFGSGLFLIWNNPTITSSQMPISNIELLYKVKNLSSSDFSESKTTQFRFSKVLEPGALTPKDYFNDKTSRPHTTSGTETGGGNVLEANSLAEVQVGVRITDTLGEYEDTWYESKTYYKSESPQFGGNLIAKQSSFRPFTCVESERFTLNSSVGASNSQDALLYNIECHVDDRKIDLYLIDSIPISTKKFNSAATDAILYPDNALGNEDIIVKKQDATTIRYEIKNKYFKDILLREKGLRTPKNNLDAVYNDDFTNVTYKIYVQDDFDATSNIYSSGVTSINFIEAPSLKHNNFLEIGINRYTKSINPFYDNSIIVLNSLSNNNDRIVNPGESIVFKFKRAKDYNAADYLTTMVGDVSQYNIYVSRNDDAVFDNYDKLNYTLLKSFNAAPVEDGGDLKKAYPNDSNDEFYYLEYPLQSYQESKFVVFKIEAVDSRNRKSEMIYSNTYLVPCRATAMDYHIGTVNLYTNTDFDPKFSTKVNDFGASKFINTKYSYKDFPNYERTYSVGVEPNKHTFTKKAYLIIEGSLDSTFEPGEITLEKEVKGEKITKTFSNKHFSFEIDFANLSKGKLYIDILNVPHLITNFPNEWEVGIKEEFIKKIFFKSTYKIAYGFKDVEKTNFDERYLYISSVSAPYSYYEDSPTVSYRNHQVGINTKDFSAGSKEGQKEVLIVQDNGSYNLVVFKGAEQKIILNLTERTFTATTNNNKEVIINFGTGLIDGMTIDGGSW